MNLFILCQVFSLNADFENIKKKGIIFDVVNEIKTLSHYMFHYTELSTDNYTRSCAYSDMILK